MIHHPEFYYYSEDLIPSYFADEDNGHIYLAISSLVNKGVTRIDPYNITEFFNSSDGTKQYAQTITVEKLNELVEFSKEIVRDTVEEYKLLVENVMETAMRRETILKLRECERMCFNPKEDNIQEKIYGAIDDVLLDFSTRDEIPQFKDVVDDYWEQIVVRQKDGCAGIPFRFPSLNNYVSIERQELVVFIGAAKAGKSMMLLNCAADLLKQNYSVLYIDSELNSRLFTARMISHLTGVEYRRLTTGAYSEEEKVRIQQAIQWVKEKNFTHIYMPIFDHRSIYTTAKKIMHRDGLDVIIVDYFKSNGDGDAYANYDRLGKIVDMVKNDICGTMNVAGIGAAQATSTGKIADSAKIARNASTIISVVPKTAEEIEEDGVDCGNRKMRVLANRNGPQMLDGEYIDLMFNGDIINYTEARQHTPHDTEPY